MQIDVSSKIKDYTLYFGEGFNFFEELVQIQPRIIIVDENVFRLYKKELTSYFLTDEIVTFKPIESNKNINSVLSLCDTVMSSFAKKNMTVISFGGGITQDVTGFLSSILYRGVNWVFIPTTLLAQADSCMGSKTSLNHNHFKNLLGSFYPPAKVYLDVSFIKTLSETDFYSGMGEIVKLHLMGGEQSIAFITKAIDVIDGGRDNPDLLSELVRNSLSIKYSYIKDDEFDTGRRNLLNYGHCFGHALESSSDYDIPHGIAVVLGIIFANLIAVERGYLSEETEQMIYEHLLSKCVKCDLKPAYFDKEAILAAMKMDKKRTGNGLPLIIMDRSFTLRKLTDLTPEELFYGIDKMFKTRCITK